MSHIRRFDHVGITVDHLDSVTAFGQHENTWWMAPMCAGRRESSSR